METKNKTNTKNVNKLNENEKMTQVFSGEHSLTILLLVISGFMVFWFLLSGAMSDNRFGTHLVMSADLTSIPAWYGLSIFFIAAFLTLSGFMLFFLLFRNRINLTESQEKTLRVGSLSMMGASAFYIALSSITFAAFNTEFFISILNKDFSWTSLAPIITPFGKFSSTTHYSMQGVVIAGMSIVTFAIIMGITSFLFFAKIEVSNKFYYSGRNAAVLMIALGWLTFNINIVAFGSMGGDASVLINGIIEEKIGYSIDFNELNGDLFISWSEMSAREFFKDVVGLSQAQWILAMTWLGPFWNEGTLDFLKIHIDLGRGLNVIFGSLGKIIFANTEWISGLSKESFIQGVNDSVASYMLFGAFILGTLASPIYIILTYFTFKDNKISIMYDWSIYTVLCISVIYGVLAWTIPYMAFANFTPPSGGIYRPIIDGFFHGEANGLAPGLIGQTGQPGGINGAIVYFSPNYHGTITWWVGFGMMAVIPFVTMGFAIWKNFDDIRSNSTILHN